MDVKSAVTNEDDVAFKNFACTECSNSFRYNIMLKKHVEKYHPDKLTSIAPQIKAKKASVHKCRYCSNRYTYLRNLTYHERSCHADESSEIPLNTSMDKNSNDCPNNETDTKFNCTECKKIYKHNNYLREHVKKCHPDKLSTIAPRLNVMKAFTYSCNDCTKNYTSLTGLRYHERKCHSDDKSKINLDNSSNEDTGKNFICTECMKIFKHDNQFREHVKKYHPEKLSTIAPEIKARMPGGHKCRFCANSFTHLKNLRYHERKRHPQEFSEALLNLYSKLKDLSDGPNDDTEKKFHCVKCTQIYKSRAELKKHIKECHSDRTIRANACNFCTNSFTHLKSLRYHVRKRHPEEVPGIELNTKNIKNLHNCPMCHTELRKQELLVHFQFVHEINLEIEKLEFESFNAFQEWKDALERTTKSKFSKRKTGHTSTHTSRHYYECHRSGKFIPKSKRFRRLKQQGTVKINGFCPAELKVFVAKEGQCSVTFTKTHVGHENDVRYLSLSVKERQIIAAKIALKIPFNSILSDIHDNMNETNLERLHLITRKDLFNIRQCANLDAVGHKDGGTNVDAWGNEMEVDEMLCALFNKPQENISDKSEPFDHQNIKDEFQSQKEMVTVSFKDESPILVVNPTEEILEETNKAGDNELCQ